MIRSMTAFARAERHAPGGTLIWELKSVNHRYLEVSPRLPEGFRELDGPLRDRCREQLNRGKLEAGLRFQPGGEAALPTLDETLVQELAAAAQRIGELLQHPAPVNPAELLRIPGVLMAPQLDSASLHQAALAALDEALEQLIANRQREGQAMAATLETRLEAVLEQVAVVREAVPGILAAQRERLSKRILELVSEPDNDRLEQELVMLAQKMDVAEEIDRLEAHVKEVRRTLAKGGNVGRRLDFLMQELNREANTIGSKSIATETTQAAVELKVLIEQMREQIQNLE